MPVNHTAPHAKWRNEDAQRDHLPGDHAGVGRPRDRVPQVVQRPAFGGDLLGGRDRLRAALRADRRQRPVHRHLRARLRRPRFRGPTARGARSQRQDVIAGATQHGDAANSQGLWGDWFLHKVTPVAEVSAEVHKRLYALMALMKAADDRLSKGIGTGEFMCVYWPSRGQEAIAAAMGVALRADDQLVTTYRGLHDLIGKGVPLEEIYGEMMGRTTGASRGKGGTMHIAKPENGVMLSTGIVGAGPPVAVGLAMSAKRKGLDRVTVVSFGDGATNTGSFHEAANMAALWDLPMVFVCQNNLYAEMTPTSDTMKLERVADRAAGYGMPGVRVDGNDPLAVKSALDEALRRARTGSGPTFIECVTFRFRGHYFGDRMPYIPKDQLAAAMAADPVPRFRSHLAEAGICAEDELDSIDKEASATVETARKAVMSAGPPPIHELDRDVYATPIKFPV